MTVEQLASLLNAEAVSQGNMNRNISGGMVCDVMSLSIARGCSGMAWVCAQANMNALAVAAMMDAACVIFVQCGQIDAKMIERARKEHMNVLITDEAAFDVVGRMYAGGIVSTTNARGRKEQV